MELEEFREICCASRRVGIAHFVGAFIVSDEGSSFFEPTPEVQKKYSMRFDKWKIGRDGMICSD